MCMAGGSGTQNFQSLGTYLVPLYARFAKVLSAFFQLHHAHLCCGHRGFSPGCSERDCGCTWRIEATRESRSCRVRIHGLADWTHLINGHADCTHRIHMQWAARLELTEILRGRITKRAVTKKSMLWQLRKTFFQSKGRMAKVCA